MSTAVMTKWVKTQAQKMALEYQGVTTQVVASSVRSLTADKAVVGVDVQQVFEGQKSDKVSRTGRAELVKNREGLENRRILIGNSVLIKF